MPMAAKTKKTSTRSRATAPSREAFVEEEAPLVRTTIGLPEEDYALIEAARQRAFGHRFAPSKSEVIRAALQCLSGSKDAAFLEAFAGVRKLKPGPKKGKASN